MQIGYRGLIAANLVLEVLDGVETYAGLSLGFREGNPLVANLCHDFGNFGGIFLAKFGACAMVILLGRSPRALWFVFWMQFFFALIPWLVILAAYGGSYALLRIMLG